MAFIKDTGPRAGIPHLAVPHRYRNRRRISYLALVTGNALTALAGKNVMRAVGRSERAGRRVVASALAISLGVAGAVIFWGAPASAASPETPHCVRTAYGYGGQSLRCYATLRQAISYATDGRVTDAPETGAEFLDSTVADAVLAKVNTAGDTARAAGGSNHLVAGIVFDAADYGGHSLTMSTTPSFARSSGPMTPCTNETQWASFWASGFTPRSLINFNGCYYGTMGIEWYANDRIRYVNSPTIPAGNDTRYINYQGGPTRKQLLDRCTAANNCTFKFDNTTTPTPSAQYYGGWVASDGMLNCSTGSQGSYELSAQKTVGGSVNVGVEVSVGTSAGFFGQKVEASFKATFGMTWNWSSTLTKKVTVTVPSGQWAGLYGRPLMLDYKGKYVLSAFPTAFYGRKSWTIENVTVTSPAGNDASQWKIIGGSIAGSEYEGLCTSSPARSSRVTSDLPQGWRIY